jgi:uncharacterized protein (DUF1499 family)
MRFILVILILLVILFIAARVMVARQPIPTNLGINNGRLKPCPETPNCVSNQAAQSDTEHYLPAIPYTGGPTFMMSQIIKVISVMPRATIIGQDDNYLHAEFRSRMFGFVDDVEFFLDDSRKLIHFRSAARLGQGDLGVNKKRMIELSEKLQAGL